MDIEKIKSNRAVDLLAENKKLEEDNKRLRKALEKLSKLGNEPYLGNSIGNKIAQQALKPIKEEPKLCICCEEITEENAHLHRNCGK